ncbi:MAG: hypothetical protein GY725_01330 [bacterium]|nr:hypothetical protein [bacterium]
MQLELSLKDNALLTRLLRRAIGETRVEVRRTSEPHMHDDLIAEEERMKLLVEQLRKLDGTRNGDGNGNGAP